MTVPDGVEVSIDRRRFAGVWANASTAIAGLDEATIDFIRIDPQEPTGTVVARVTCSPPFLRSLIDDLEQIWDDWVQRTSPPETGGPRR